MKEDWYEKQVYFKSETGLKRCLPEDFGPDEDSQYYWHTWITDTYAFDLFCPDYGNQNLALKNKKGDMISKSIVFNIDKCIDTPENPGFCKSEEEIADFISDVTVQLWVINSNLDLRYNGDNSTTRIHKLVKENKIQEKD